MIIAITWGGVITFNYNYKVIDPSRAIYTTLGTNMG